jgi:NADH:ubiquinone oxidoreductase subunit E
LTITDQKGLRTVLREKFPRNHGELLPALHLLQHEFGYLPDWAMEVVGWHLGIPASEVYGGATSYTELRIRRPGQHVLRVCTGLGCAPQGGNDLLTGLREKLQVEPGHTTSDGRITLEETACAFMCGVAPVVQWDHEWHGRVSQEALSGLLRNGDEA